MWRLSPPNFSVQRGSALRDESVPARAARVQLLMLKSKIRYVSWLANFYITLLVKPLTKSATVP